MSTVMADMSVGRRSNVLLPALVGGCAAAAVDAAYGIASWRWTFMRELSAVRRVLRDLDLPLHEPVVPLSAFPFSFAPFTVSKLSQGMLMHVLLVGLPISLSFRVLGRERANPAHLRSAAA